jgi:hypothetical protein
MSEGSASMQIDYELTQRDFVESFAAHRQRNRISKWLTRLFMSLFLLFAAFIALGLIIKPNAQDAKNLAPFFGLICYGSEHSGRSHGGTLENNS